MFTVEYMRRLGSGDVARRALEAAGRGTAGIFVSGTWFQVEAGSNVISYTNTTGTGTRTLTAYPSFSL